MYLFEIFAIINVLELIRPCYLQIYMKVFGK